VPDLELEALPPLGGYREAFGGTELTEVTDLAIVSLAVPQGREAPFEAALSGVYGATRPAPGFSTLSADGRTRFLWTAPDQLFALFEDMSPMAADEVEASLGGAAYVTLQSDNWLALRLSGGKAHAALERICPIDLHPAAFPDGRVARTAMEHMGAFILRERVDSFLLLSASSSARSFLHAVKTSLLYVS